MAIEDAGAHLVHATADHATGKGIDAALGNPKLRTALIIGGGTLLALYLYSKGKTQAAAPAQQAYSSLMQNPGNYAGANNVGAYGSLPFSDMLSFMQQGGYLSVAPNLAADIAQINANEQGILDYLKKLLGTGGTTPTGTTTAPDCTGKVCARGYHLNAQCGCDIDITSPTCPPGWKIVNGQCCSPMNPFHDCGASTPPATVPTPTQDGTVGTAPICPSMNPFSRCPDNYTHPTGTPAAIPDTPPPCNFMSTMNPFSRCPDNYRKPAGVVINPITGLPTVTVR